MSHNHHHCHDHEHSDSCSSSNKHSCCCHHHEHEAVCEHDHHEDFATKVLAMADEAWEELLMEKIKARIEKQSGNHLDKLAELIANANKKRWEHKLECNSCVHELHDELRQFFQKKG